MIRKADIKRGAHAPRVQFSAPSRKTSNAPNCPAHSEPQRAQFGWTRGASSNTRGGCAPRIPDFGIITLRNNLVSVLTVLAISAHLALVADNPARRPAPSLTHPDTAEITSQANGFIQRWLILEPIRANGLTDSIVQAAVKTEYFSNRLTVIPHDGDTVAVGGTNLAWHAVETKEYNVNLYPFAYALGKPTSFVLFWAVTIVNCPHEIPGVRLAIGSNAASVWWVNGQEVIGIYGDRRTVIDDGASKRLTLKKGPNIVRCAVINGGGATDFCARFLDAEGNLLKGFTVSVGDVAKGRDY